MRILPLMGVTLLAVAAPAAAQVQEPARHSGNGTAIADTYRFMLDDRARLRDGRAERAMAAARENMEAYAKLRAATGGRPQARGR